MNSLKSLLLIAGLVAALALPAAHAQDEEAYRGIFLSHASSTAQGKPGAKINLELLRGKKREMVPLDTVFRAGDKVKLHFKVNFPAHVTIYNQEPSGVKKRLFPYDGEKKLVQPVKKYIVPRAADEWFEFDNKPGTERLTFIFAAAPAAKSSAAPTKPARPSTPARPANDPRPGRRDRVLVRGEDDEAEDNDQAAEDDVDQETQASGGLNRVKVGADQYYFGTADKLRQRVVIRLNLKHQRSPRLAISP